MSKLSLSLVSSLSRQPARASRGGREAEPRPTPGTDRRGGAFGFVVLALATAAAYMIMTHPR